MPNPISKTCPQCGAPIPAQAPEGLCPRCVAALNLQGETVLTGVAEVTAGSAPSITDLAPHFPQLEVLEYLGRGGMGVVYKARQRTLNRLVALKLIAPERVADAKFAARFAEEAKALAALSHPNIVTIYDFGQAGGFYYLLMEFVDGVNLRQAMKAGRFTPEQALSVVPPVCDGLQYAHEHGIVHRDIKPENLLLDRAGRVKIADFGIAKMLGSGADGVTAAQSQPAGTPQYMAPEQRTEPGRAGQRADIYSLGVVLYEMLTGELPAGGLQAPSKRVRVDVRIDEIVLRALETKPELRYATAAEFGADVEQMTTERARTAARSGPRSIDAEATLITIALGIVIFFVCVSFGFWMMESLNVHSTGGTFSGVFVALLLALPLAPAIARRMRRRLESGDAWEIKTAHGWLKAFAWVAFLFGTLGVGLGVFFVLALASEQWAWNPSPTEAVVVPVILLGAVLLPMSGRVLWRAARQIESNVSKTPGMFARILRATFVLLGIALAIFVFAVGAWLLVRKSTPSVKVTCAGLGVMGNALMIDIHAMPSGAPAAVWVSFEGPEMDSAKLTSARSYVEGSVTDVLHPTETGSSLPPRVMNEINVWRVAFLFPTPALANEALVNVRPMGSFEMATDRQHSGTIFEVKTKDGQTYRASCFVGSPELTQSLYHRLEQSRSSSTVPLAKQPPAQPETKAIGTETAVDSSPTGHTAVISRTFSLRHRLASEMKEDLRPIVPERQGVEVSTSEDNQQLTIKGPAAVVDRAATFIAVTDWPDALKNAATGEYLASSVLRAARSFFHACAMEESSATFSKLLSPHVLAVLKGEAKSEQYQNYLTGGVPDPQWEASLRADWPGKEEAIRKFVASWNRCPLKRLTERPGIAMGFGVKHFCSVSFDGAPKEFYEVTIEPARTKPAEGEEARLYFSSLPPWWQQNAGDGSEASRTK